ncbi:MULTISPECIES: RluA family pseudouridine synthase [Bacillus]|uniref:RluA family pseudouridine synthase n=1 Tax=Bacillus TaxID=1386 RepID=UPI0002E4138F|nr:MULTISPECIES: RluA family pseudouridine synthase [Bacillus]
MISTSKKGQFLEIVVPKEWTNFSIEDLLRTYWKAPKKLVHEWRMQKSILLNNQTVPWNTKLQEDDTLLLPMFKETTNTVEPFYQDIQILYEDEFMIIVNKPAGMETHPSQPNQSDTLLNAVAFYLLSEGHQGDLKHLHRLDKDTSGAIIFSKNEFTGAILHRMLEERNITRTYKALVHGKVRDKKGTISANIGRDRHHATRRRVSPTGQHAITHYEVIQYDNKTKLTLIKCKLDTGRTHQIRVHLSHIGHPLAGDILYGGKPIFKRQALHAYQITLKHPITEELLTIQAPFLDEPAIF